MIAGLAAVVVLVGACIAWTAIGNLARERNDWKNVADDAVSLLDRAGEQFETPVATRAWEARVARCVAHYNALLEPEG